MTIAIPLTTILPPQWRILRRRTWASPWDILPYTKLIGGNWTQGFFVEEFWRSCIPEPGQATLRYDMGLIDGVVYGTDTTTGLEAADIDLVGQVVRIQTAPGDESGTEPAWQTVWVGVVEYQEDSIAPGGDILIGSRKYHCMDLLASYTKKQAMSRHGMYSGGQMFVPAYGHPGYNGKDWDGQVLGNKEPTGTKWYDSGFPMPWSAGDNLEGAALTSFKSKLFNHTHQGISTNSAAVWTDLQAVENALASSRQPNTPFFYIAGATTLLDGVNAWPVDDGINCWDILTDVFKRQRGRGLAFLDWDSDSGSPTGDLTVYIRLNPQTLADISYTPPVGAAGTVVGATTQATTVAVDLEGDHRNVSPTFTLGDRYQHVYQYVESLGERIEVLVTLDYSTDGGLESRWAAAEETQHATDYAISAAKVRSSRRYDPAWQLHGLAKAWSGKSSNGNGSTSRSDYRCNDFGVIETGTSDRLDTAPTTVKVMHDVPLYQGYNYAAATPVRYDAAAETMAPNRLKPLLMAKVSADRYIRLDQAPYDCSISIYDYGIQIDHVRDVEAGTRYFSGVGSAVGGVVAKTAIICTVCLQLPHHVRMATGDVNGMRKKQIFHRGLHLWLANPLAIWDLSTVTYAAGAGGAAGKREACLNPLGGPGLLRDDRARLAREHAMAAYWYMTERRTASWQLKACGFLPGFYQADSEDNVSSTLTAYPTIGKLVTTMRAAGATYTINTPITKVHFTNRGNGVTTWITDWSDLDLR